MMKKIAILIGAILCAVVASISFVTWIEDDYKSPELPVKSTPNKVMVTSNGCCLWAENVVVSIMDNEANKTIISKNDKVVRFDIFTNDIPNVNYSPIYLMVELDLFYGKYYNFSSKIFEFADLDELKKSGILIYIQEADGAYVNALLGNRHISYKLNYNPDEWEKQINSKQIYP